MGAIVPLAEFNRFRGAMGFQDRIVFICPLKAFVKQLQIIRIVIYTKYGILFHGWKLTFSICDQPWMVFKG